MPQKLPTFFIPHGGGPCFFMESNPSGIWDRLAAWLKGMAATLDAEPEFIVVISGHWEEDEFSVMGNARPPLLFDYYGFPEHTYRLTYPAPGAPELAQRVSTLLAEGGIPARTDAQRGFDHGVFIPFKLMFPDARIPVMQLSLKTGLDPATHIACGRALQPLREQGVLIVGSGMSYHNLRGFFSPTEATCDPFDEWLTAAACSAPVQREQSLAAWRRAPCARLAHPREEHLLPLMVAAGAAGEDQGQRVFNDRIMGELISAYRFG
ncbi:MAG TPA: class III extradiol ring-cleavage dioxygenase [Bryobacteraceae bacterium]|nr:class III extradiol ring-cleavage dioxygenase [Bryobacteraceae bacterium]